MKRFKICAMVLALILIQPVFAVSGAEINSRQTSVTDEEDYRAFCLLAATNDDVFDHFKRSPALIRVMQHVSFDLGKDYLNIIKYDYPNLLTWMDKFKENDLVGDPIIYNYGPLGLFSPTNLRYIKILGDLKERFGDLTGLKVIEIGGGYGGQCKVLSDLFTFEQYTIVDLPEPLALAEKYLDVLRTPSTRFLTMEELDPEEEYDVVISNYAFSECARDVQKEYLEKVIAKSRFGYMICNQIGYFSSPKPYGVLELLQFFNEYGFSAQLQSEEPKSSPNNYLLTWER